MVSSCVGQKTGDGINRVYKFQHQRQQRGLIEIEQGGGDKSEGKVMANLTEGSNSTMTQSSSALSVFDCLERWEPLSETRQFQNQINTDWWEKQTTHILFLLLLWKLHRDHSKIERRQWTSDGA